VAAGLTVGAAPVALAAPSRRSVRCRTLPRPPARHPFEPSVSELADRLQADLNAARKAQDKALTLVLGTVLADVKNRRIELRRDPSDEEIVEVLRRGIKRRRESIDMYEKGNREELAAKERQELAVLEGYLPPAVDPEELRAAVRAAIAGGAANIGAVMGKVMPQFKGRVDGSAINAMAREELGK
jgi:uncharacterized protein YqeY